MKPVGKPLAQFRETLPAQCGRGRSACRWSVLGWLGWIVLGGIPCAGCMGCGPSGAATRGNVSAPATTVGLPPALPQAVLDKVLEGAMSVLGHLDNYDEALARAQVFDRLNQWSHAVGVPAGSQEWRIDPLIETLPLELRESYLLEQDASVHGASGSVRLQPLDSGVFDASADVTALRDQRWLADIAAYARGDAIDDIDVAKNIFDWTIRSLAISSDPPMVPTATNPGSRWFLPGEILLSGRASGPQRAWIFLELVRHAGLDGVMLATGDATLQPWIPAVLSGGEAYLFEPTYGMPIPGPRGEGVATARLAASDPSILGGLSLPDRPYPVQAADIAGLSVLVAATPESLSRRMQMLDEHLAGGMQINLAVAATPLGQRACSALPGNGGGSPKLWEFPWEVLRRRRTDAATVNAAIGRELAVMGVTMQQSAVGGQSRRVVRPLYAARLREFRGELDGADGAKLSYLLARPANAAIAEAVKQAPPPQADAIQRLYEQMKQDATYWLGSLTLAEKDYETAADYLDRMTLQAAPDGRWADAARTHLARVWIGMGRNAKAIELLREDPSPQRFGSRLLADSLEKKTR